LYEKKNAKLNKSSGNMFRL